MLNGIDVSHWQSFTEDYYESLSNQQLSFVFIKASEGIYTDKAFKTHNEHFAKSCLLKGAYHFLRFKSSPQEQAATFLERIKDIRDPGLDLPPVLDVEDVNEEKKPNECVADIKTWCKIVKDALNVDPIIYTGGWYWRDPNRMANTEEFKGHKLWTSQYKQTYLPMYGGWIKPTFWQYTETGDLPGYNGHIDKNYFFDDIDALWGMTNAKGIKVQPDVEVKKIYALQTRLLHLGFYIGLIDGKCGPNTMKAINTWSATKGLQAVTDTITPTHWRVLFNLDNAQAQPIPQAPTTVANISLKPSGTVIPSLLNIRQGPDGTQPMVSMPLPKGKKVDILGEQDGWLRVSVDIEGWVKKTLIQQQ